MFLNGCSTVVTTNDEFQGDENINASPIVVNDDNILTLQDETGYNKIMGIWSCIANRTNDVLEI